MRQSVRLTGSELVDKIFLRKETETDGQHELYLPLINWLTDWLRLALFQFNYEIQIKQAHIVHSYNTENALRNRITVKNIHNFW